MLEDFAALIAAQRQTERAARMWGAAERLREEIGAPVLLGEQEEYNRLVASARQAVSEEAFSTAWAQGRTMTMEEAIEYVLEEHIL